MIDVYATAGTFTDKHKLASDLAATLMASRGFRTSRCSARTRPPFVHELPAGDLSNVDGASSYVRVQVLTNAGALDRAKQIAVVSEFTSMVADAAHDPALRRPHLGPPDRGVPGAGGLAVTRTPMTSLSRGTQADRGAAGKRRRARRRSRAAAS
jgi:hypothetical protein